MSNKTDISVSLDEGRLVVSEAGAGAVVVGRGASILEALGEWAVHSGAVRLVIPPGLKNRYKLARVQKGSIITEAFRGRE